MASYAYNPITNKIDRIGDNGGGGGSGIQNLAGNTGTATGSTVNLETANTTATFVASGDTVTLDFDENNLLIGSNGASITSGSQNVGVGKVPLDSLQDGAANVCMGWAAGNALTSGAGNCAIGANALLSNQNGLYNVAMGLNALTNFTGASLIGNIAIGQQSLNGPGFTGDGNICLGQMSGMNYEGTESNNICFSHDGVPGDQNTIRIGDQGTGDDQQDKCFIAGIAPVTLVGSSPVGINSSGQLSNLGFGSSGQVLRSNGNGVSPSWATPTPPGTGTVTSVSVVSANGLSGSVSNPTTTPSITLSTTIGANQPVYSAGSSLAGAGAGTSGQVFTSNGGGTPPSWQTLPAGISQVVVRTFASNVTYTPSAGMKYCIVEAVGGGGGGGGTVDTVAGQCSAGGGGASGSYARARLTAAQVGASQAVTIGAGGAGGTPTDAFGGSGGTTTLGSLVSASGGTGGRRGISSAVSIGGGGAGNGASLVGTYTCIGNPGNPGMAFYVGTTSYGSGGNGGNTVFGAGALGPTGSIGENGVTAVGQGGGGSGAYSMPSQTGKTGGAGDLGLIIITEYI